MRSSCAPTRRAAAHARFLLEQGRLPIETIAFDTGFGDRERMRRAFLRAYSQTPLSIRNAANVLAAI
jgi:transcriptional regulator GlxA family with amidase domain